MRSPAEHLLVPVENPWVGDQARCSVIHSRSRPLVIEWPAADRGSLERHLGRGLAVVRYEGCRMEVLRGCHVPGSRYRYGGFTRKAEEVRMRDADELHANLPIGASALEGKLARASALSVEIAMVGMHEADRDGVYLDELQGRCEGATHLVSGVQVGAYAFWLEREAELGGAAGLAGGPGVGVRSRVERELLSSDGDPAACAQASLDDSAPPAGCGAVIRLEVVPLGEARTVEPGCPGGLQWNGPQCERTEPPRECPDDGVLQGGAQCRRDPAPCEDPERCAPSPEGGAITSSPALPRGSAGCPEGMARVPGGADGELAIGDFCLDLTEVTAGAYAQCVEDGACTRAATTAWWPKLEGRVRDAASELCTAGRSDRAAHPINCVTVEQAEAHCAWRGARLPSEAEWQWAARGGEQGRDYPWGEQAPDLTRANACGTECRAWFQRRDTEREAVAFEADDGWAGTAPVGRFPAGAGRWGHLDLAGNVAEWTSDISTRRKQKRRVVGGSFWAQRPGWLRTEDTIAADPVRRDPVIGFRCADDL